MRGIILSGHGNFASGLTSSLDLITGIPENFYFHDFLQDMTQEGLTELFQESINKLQDCDEIVLITDIVGGTPFKSAVLMSLQYPKLKVVSGTNLPFLLSLHFGLMDEGKSIDEIIDTTLEEAREALLRFDPENY